MRILGTVDEGISINFKYFNSMPQSEHNAPDDKPLYTEEQVQEIQRFNKINMDDYYAVLAIEKNADDLSVKKAYKRLALKFHPDKNRAPGADEAFKAVSRAFTVLSDEGLRRQYDMHGAQGTSTSGFAHSHPAQMSPEEVFAAFFGQFSSGQHPLFTQTHFSGSPFHFHFGSSQFPFQGGIFGSHNLFQSHPFFAQHGPFGQRHHRRHHEEDERGDGDAEVEELIRRLREMAPLIFFLLLSLILSYIWP